MDPKILFAKRLNHALDLNKIPPKGKGRQVIVAKMFGVSTKGASKWLEGQTFPDLQKIVVIANKLNVNIEWLTYGTGAINVEPLPAPGSPGWRKLPLISWEQTISVRKIQPTSETEWVWTDVDMGPYSYALVIQDDSMEPRFELGAIITVDPDLVPQHRRIVIVHWEKTDTAGCAQLLIDGPYRYLKPHNPSYVTTLIDEKNPQAVIIGTVVQVFMKY